MTKIFVPTEVFCRIESCEKTIAPGKGMCETHTMKHVAAVVLGILDRIQKADSDIEMNDTIAKIRNEWKEMIA